MRILLICDDTETSRMIAGHLEQNWEKMGDNRFQLRQLTLTFIAIRPLPFELYHLLYSTRKDEPYNRVILVGLTLATTRIIDIGEVVNIGRELFGDLGIEGHDGEFEDLFDLRIIPPNEPPFFKRELFNEEIINPLHFKVVKGITLNKIPGTFENIERLTKKYHAETVSQTGAHFAFICHLLNYKYLQLRSVFRYLEPTTHPDREKEMACASILNKIVILLEDWSHGDGV